MKRFNALIIDPNRESRTALKDLLNAEQLYQHLVYQGVSFANNLIDGLTRLSEDERTDIVFISSRFPLAEIRGFIETSKANEQQGGTAHILLLPAGAQDGSIVAQGLMVGADGFLILPCSVEQLREITNVAQGVKAAAQERMLRGALSLLIQTMLHEIDSKAEEYAKTGKLSRFGRDFRDSTINLILGNPQARKQYLELLEESLSQAKPAEDRATPRKGTGPAKAPAEPEKGELPRIIRSR